MNSRTRLSSCQQLRSTPRYTSSLLAIGNRHREAMSGTTISQWEFRGNRFDRCYDDHDGDHEQRGRPRPFDDRRGRESLGIPIPTETQAQGGAAVAATTAETTTVQTENATVNRLRMPRRKGLSANRPIINWTKEMTANDVSILARGRENGDRHLVREQ